jgi:exportin-1
VRREQIHRKSAYKYLFDHHFLLSPPRIDVDQMAKPEEVIVVEDENGEIVREQTKDTEVIAQYKTMKEALVYLTHLNYEDTSTIMLMKLDAQITPENLSWNGLNTLCWAVGSISGAMSENEEKRFLISVIKDLLKLCEETRGKDNKAVVASNIMYIVGQYPRFLRAHWKFLKTVINKLFEFMHELHPGVQDMACDTFLKIAQKCKRKFMTPQPPEDDIPFILTLIGDLGKHTADLQPHQVQSFYESVGTMLSDVGPPIPRDEVMVRMMELETTNWKALLAHGSADISALADIELMRRLRRILRINTSACRAAGSIYIHQLTSIFGDMMSLYQLYSQQVIQACREQGPMATRLLVCKTMRGVKSDILELINTFFEVSSDLPGGPQVCLQMFFPTLMEQTLVDYSSSPPAARDPRVLTLYATAISTFREHIADQVPVIMASIFGPTLEMITANMSDHPDHRIGFFRFLRQANEHCFFGLFGIPPEQQKLVVDSIVWAFKHTERNIAETGLEILQELLVKISANPQVSDSFFQSYMLSLIQDVLGVLSDRMHKSGFKSQAAILKHMFHAVQLGQVGLPLFDLATMPQGTDNPTFLKDHIGNLLIEAFPEVSRGQIIAFIVGLFDVSKDLEAFKQHLRDFLVTARESDAGKCKTSKFLRRNYFNFSLQLFTTKWGFDCCICNSLRDLHSSCSCVYFVF